MEHRAWDDEAVDWLSDTVGRQMLSTEHLTVARIHLKAGAVVPVHDHANEQVANVLVGRLRFTIGGEEAIVSGGESIAIPSGVPHEVAALTDALVIDVFSPRREDWLRGEDAYLRR